MHTGLQRRGGPKFARVPDVVFTSKDDCIRLIGYIRINLEIYSLSYEKRNCSVRVQLAAN